MLRQGEIHSNNNDVVLPTESISLTNYIERFYESFSTLPSALSIPKELEEYTKNLYEFHKRPQPSLDTSIKISNPITPLNPNRVLIPFSGGADSTAAILWAKEKGFDCYLFHVSSLNQAAATREEKAVVAIAETFGMSDKLIQIKHPTNLKKMKAYQTYQLSESPAKNQYIWLQALSYMQQFQCGKIIFSIQNSGNASHFSDTPPSFNLFQLLATALIGQHQWLSPYQTKTEYLKALIVHDRQPSTPQLFSMSSSCFRRDQFFLQNQKVSRSQYDDVQDNECGSCKKCVDLRDIRQQIRDELNIPAPQNFKKNIVNSQQHATVAKKQNPLYKTLLGLLPESKQSKYLEHPVLIELMPDIMDRRTITNEEFETIAASNIKSTEIEALIDAIIFKHPENDFVNNGEVCINLKNLVDTYHQIQIPDKIANKSSLFEIFIRAIVIRAILEIRNHRIDYPFKKISLEDAKQDFQNLQAYQAHEKKLTLKAAGRKASGFFLTAERLKVPAIFSKYGPSIAWQKNSLLFTPMRTLIQDHIVGKKLDRLTAINSDEIRNCYERNKTVDQFRPATVLEVIAILRDKDPSYKVRSAFDPCGGWADRLVGFLAANIKNIVYNDVNKDLKEGYTQVVKTYSHQEQQVHLFFKAAEDLTIDEMCPNKERHQLILTGVPFFTKEKYLGNDQAHIRYPQLTEWLHGFLYPMVIKAGSALDSQQGYIVLNIADFRINGHEIQLVDPLKNFIRTQIPFLTLLDVELKYPRACINTQNKNETPECSPLLVIKRNGNPLQSIPRLLEASYSTIANKPPTKNNNKKRKQLTEDSESSTTASSDTAIMDVSEDKPVDHAATMDRPHLATKVMKFYHPNSKTDAKLDPSTSGSPSPLR